MTFSNLQKFLPSKKFNSVLGAIILTIIIIAVAFYLPPVISKYSKLLFTSPTNTFSAEKIAAIEKIQSLDSDNDGLPDWEEALWKTDPKNPDTDGDSMTDGEEVRTGHDPLVKGPNDLLSTTMASTTEMINGEATSTTPKTETEKMAISFFSEYLQLKQASGGTLSETDKTNLINKIIDQTQVATTSYKTYTKKNLTLISGQVTTKIVSDYKINIRKAFSDAAKINPIRPKEGEMAIIEKASIDLDATELKKLDPIIKEYKAIVKNLLSVPVPSSFVNEHLALVNSVSGVTETISIMKDKFNDPLVVFKITRDYENFVINMTNTINSLGDAIDKLLK